MMEFFFEKTRIDAFFCKVRSGEFSLSPEQVLSDRELGVYRTFKTESGKRSFLLGRYSAKLAYFKLVRKNNLRDISIENGVFGQPIIVAESDFDVSIAHSCDVGCAIVFDKAYPMGIDVEVAKEDKIDVLKSVVTNREIEHVDTLEKDILTVAWSLKESLSKCIKTGLTIPIELLQLENLSKSGNFFVCSFKNFSQYAGVAKIENGYSIAISYPHQLQLKYIGGV